MGGFMLKKAFLLAVVGVLLLGASLQASAADMSVVYVHAQRLLNESPQIQDLKKRVRDEFAERDKRLIEMQKQVKQLEDKLEQDAEEMTMQEQRRLRHDISTRHLKNKHARDELTQDKQLRYSEEEERVARVIREVIEQVAQDEKIDIVLQSSVLWVSPEADITDKVLGRLKELFETGK
jgi:outer membrane protein